jgi:hypothetical protein
MSRNALPLAVNDLSAFAKTLRSQLRDLEHDPSHVEMLNLVCRSAGYRNYQSFRADASARSRSGSAAPEINQAIIGKVIRHFDDEGRMLRWPGRAKLAELCLWVLWSRIPSGAEFGEAEFGAMLDRWHVFGDRALLRRALFDTGKIDRMRDGSSYRRIEQKPPDELRPLLAILKGRETAGGAASAP